MTKRSLSFAMVFIVLCAFLTSTGVTKSVYDTQDKVSQYSFPRTDRPLTKLEVSDDGVMPNSTQGRVSYRSSLGTAIPAASPGITIKNTFEDWQYYYKSRRIDNAGLTSIHFMYSDQPTAAEDAGGSGFGYNVYDPTNGGGWPKGLGVGCHIQNTDVSGYWPNLAVTPDDRVVMVGMDNISGQGVSGRAEFHAYENNAFSSCFTGGGSIIDDDVYSPFWIDPTNDLRHPVVAVQLWNGDTITHIVAGEGIHNAPDPGAPTVLEAVALYFRKVNGGPLGASTTWIGPTVMDTASARPEIAASSISGKVAVVYFDHKATAFTNDEDWDNDVFYRMSTDGGAAWGTRVNVTNYDRMEDGYAPQGDKYLMFDSDDELHITFMAQLMPAEYWSITDFILSRDGLWGHFYPMSNFHWSTRAPQITRIANRDYPSDLVDQGCGMGGFESFLDNTSISECNGRLYCIYTGYNDYFNGIFNNCATYSPENDWRYMANGEIHLRVSSSLDGVLWDAARNLTNTPSVDCDSATGGGVCYSDKKSSMAPYGYDSAAFGEELTFPGTELVVIDPEYSGSSYLNIMYIEDHFPGSWLNTSYLATDNNMNWMRIGCIDPVTASAIAYTPVSIGYPEYEQHGDSRTIPITVTNDGNTTLNISAIDAVMVSPAGSWLTTSEASLTVSAGVNNTATFDIMLNADGNIDSPGTIVALNGRVDITSDAPSPRDLVTYTISNFMVADTIVGLVWDTLSTGTTRIAVASHGEMGRNGGNGEGGVNLDFTAFGADCDSLGATIYMYSGGPMLMQVSGADTFMNYAMHSGTGFADPVFFKPVTGFADPADVSGANYEAFFTGTFVNWDSTIAVEKTIYAPTGGGDSTNFIIQSMRVFPLDGMTHSNLAIGEMVDWDIPTDSGGDNAFVTVAGKTVYFQGYDDGDPADTLCQDNANRLAAQGFLGMYNNSEYNSDACANDANFWGVYAGRNDSDLFNPPDTAARLWRNTLNNTGLNGLAETTDIHGVMTFVHGVDLAAGDTLTFYSVFVSVQDGNVAELEGHLTAACAWYQENLRPGCTVCGCCVGLTGNVDASLDENPDLGDLTALIDYLFISFTVPTCLAEANVDGSVDPNPDLGDLTALIDYLFISFTPPAPCQ